MNRMAPDENAEMQHQNIPEPMLNMNDSSEFKMNALQEIRKQQLISELNSLGLEAVPKKRNEKSGEKEKQKQEKLETMIN
jgi:hypothetical protein